MRQGSVILVFGLIVILVLWRWAQAQQVVYSIVPRPMSCPSVPDYGANGLNLCYDGTLYFWNGAGWAAVVSGAGSVPTGTAPQIVGYTSANTAEAETVSKDCSFARTGTNAYSITCTTAGGGSGNFRAGSLGVGVAADGNPGDIAATGGIGLGTVSSGLGPFTGGTILLDNYVEGVNNNVYFLLGIDNTGTSQVNVLKIDASNVIHFGDNTHGFLLDAGLATTIALSVNGVTKLMAQGTGTSLGTDNAVNTMARMPLSFSTSSTTTATNFGVFKTVKAITIENVEVVDELATGCAAGSVIRVYDCGTSAPANAACSGGTQKTTVTTSSTAGTTVDGTVSSAAVAAGHYLGAQIQALGGSCTAVMIALTLMARPQ